VFIYDVALHEKGNRKGHGQQLHLEKIGSKCLYLDEVIDIKLIKQDAGHNFAVMCSNNESLKLYNMSTGEVELYLGHSDIILCLDVFSRDGKTLIVTGSKDNQIRLWSLDASRSFQQRMKCLAVFKGHTANISGVCFAPKRCKFFTSVSQDNTLKVWKVPEDAWEADEEYVTQEITSA